MVVPTQQRLVRLDVSQPKVEGVKTAADATTRLSADTNNR